VLHARVPRSAAFGGIVLGGGGHLATTIARA
jgi:hypothetical protein